MFEESLEKTLCERKDSSLSSALGPQRLRFVLHHFPGSFLVFTLCQLESDLGWQLSRFERERILRPLLPVITIGLKVDICHAMHLLKEDISHSRHLLKVDICHAMHLLEVNICHATHLLKVDRIYHATQLLKVDICHATHLLKVDGICHVTYLLRVDICHATYLLKVDICHATHLLKVDIFHSSFGAATQTAPLSPQDSLYSIR